MHEFGDSADDSKYWQIEAIRWRRRQQRTKVWIIREKTTSIDSKYCEDKMSSSWWNRWMCTLKHVFFCAARIYLLPTWCEMWWGIFFFAHSTSTTSVWITHSIEWTQVNRMFDTVYFFFCITDRNQTIEYIHTHTHTYRQNIGIVFVSFCFISAARFSLICFQKILPMHGSDCWQKVFVHTWKFDRKFFLKKERKNFIETGCNLKCAFVFVQTVLHWIIGFAINIKWKCFWCLRERIN